MDQRTATRTSKTWTEEQTLPPSNTRHSCIIDPIHQELQRTQRRRLLLSLKIMHKLHLYPHVAPSIPLSLVWLFFPLSLKDLHFSPIRVFFYVLSPPFDHIAPISGTGRISVLSKWLSPLSNSMFQNKFSNMLCSHRLTTWPKK